MLSETDILAVYNSPKVANQMPGQDMDQARWPRAPEDVETVRSQLARMLSDPLFSQSRRYPRLLRRIVEDSLAGNIDNLKERVLGIELFDRAPDYDTNADAIVRVTAAEIRKRIAQYYHAQEHQTEPRIDLPVGGYVAEFRPPQAESPSETSPSPAEVNPFQVVEQPTSGPVRERKRSRRRMAITLLASAVLILAGVLLSHRWWRVQDAVDDFWEPYIKDGAAPLICVGQLPVLGAPQGPQDSLARLLLNQKPVSISDAVVVSEYATYMGTKEIRPRIQVSTATTYSDLRQHPVLLVGGLDNHWTLRFLGGLRYRMHSESNSSVLQIFDSSNPDGQAWKIDFAAPATHVSEDYAIVGRFYAPTTESTVVIAAGLGENGTAAAADFLLHSKYLNEIEPGSPEPWKKKNMEIVLKTQIIEGNTGPPEVVARYFW